MIIVPGQSGKDLCDRNLPVSRRDILRKMHGDADADSPAGGQRGLLQEKKVEDVSQTPGVPVSPVKARSHYASGHVVKLFVAASIHRAWTAL